MIVVARSRVASVARGSALFALQYCFKSIRLPCGSRTKGKQDQMREAPMTTGAQALLFAGEFICLLFAAIVMMYFADRLRSDVLKSLDEPSKRQNFREQR